MKLEYFTPSSAAPRPAVAGGAGGRLLASAADRPGWGVILGIVTLASGLALAVVVVLGLILA